jgi:hypothetical protein
MELTEYFEELSAKIRSAKTDIEILAAKVQKENKEKGKDTKENKKLISSTTIEPVTRLRKDLSEVKNEQENPEIQFAIDRINDAFK